MSLLSRYFVGMSAADATCSKALALTLSHIGSGLDIDPYGFFDKLKYVWITGNSHIIAVFHSFHSRTPLADNPSTLLIFPHSIGDHPFSTYAGRGGVCPLSM